MFRPCIDLHQGKVKQIVGSTFSKDDSKVETNFVSDRDSQWYASLFKKDELFGGHVIMLGKGNERAAIKALESFPQGLQVGGGIHSQNAKEYLDHGASHVIITSWLFPEGQFSIERLENLEKAIGKKRIVVDLSCKKVGEDYRVAIHGWQTMTDFYLSKEQIILLEKYCDEFLIHAVHVEGKQKGVDWELVNKLSKWGSCPITYAGGANSIQDLEKIEEIGKGRLHLTIGSSLDIFGGDKVLYQDALAFNQKLTRETL